VTRLVLLNLRSLAARAATVVRQVVGGPDYERYVAHVRVHHPDATPLDRTAFYRARLNDRYDKPGAKCC
jgi:uncharacterized short protein YbdD (DUF466 family)